MKLGRKRGLPRPKGGFLNRKMRTGGSRIRPKRRFGRGGRMRGNGMRGMYHNPFAGIGFLLIIVIVLLGVGYIGLVDFIPMIILSVGLIITFIGLKILRFMMIGIGILTIVGAILYLSIISGTF